MRNTLKQIASWAFPPPAVDPVIKPANCEYRNYVDMVHLRFKQCNPTVKPPDCNFYIGDEGIPFDLRSEIIGARSHLHGVPVSFIPGAVGVVLLPPHYRSATLAKAKAAPRKVRVRAKKEDNGHTTV
jgi:hypothetical protein